MKKTGFFFLCVAFSFSNYSFTQVGSKPFEGKIVYEISYPGLDMDITEQAMFPTETIVYFKDGKQRTEMQMGSDMSNASITDSKAKTSVTLMKMMGSKYAIKMDSKEIESEQLKNLNHKVTVSGETKKILGYTCKKANVVIDDETNSETTIYFSEELNISNVNWGSKHFSNINGVLLEYQTKRDGIIMQMKAKSIKAEPVSESLFIVPSDYVHVSQHELSKILMGGGK
jgi:GLPGLI family protein